jgi:hypothetical protein
MVRATLALVFTVPTDPPYPSPSALIWCVNALLISFLVR